MAVSLATQCPLRGKNVRTCEEDQKRHDQIEQPRVDHPVHLCSQETKRSSACADWSRDFPAYAALSVECIGANEPGEKECEERCRARLVNGKPGQKIQRRDQKDAADAYGADKQVYEAKCAACHGVDAKGGPQYGTMVGGIGSFTTDKRILTPGSMYPYAPILFDYIRRAMPMDRPQSLSADEVYAVSAYLLHLNGLIPADAVMDARTLPQVQMPNRNGFILDDRPDTKAVRCMKDCIK